MKYQYSRGKLMGCAFHTLIGRFASSEFTAGAVHGRLQTTIQIPSAGRKELQLLIELIDPRHGSRLNCTRDVVSSKVIADCGR